MHHKTPMPVSDTPITQARRTSRDARAASTEAAKFAQEFSDWLDGEPLSNDREVLADRLIGFQASANRLELLCEIAFLQAKLTVERIEQDNDQRAKAMARPPAMRSEERPQPMRHDKPANADAPTLYQLARFLDWAWRKVADNQELATLPDGRTACEVICDIRSELYRLSRRDRPTNPLARPDLAEIVAAVFTVGELDDLLDAFKRVDELNERQHDLWEGLQSLRESVFGHRRQGGPEVRTD